MENHGKIEKTLNDIQSCDTEIELHAAMQRIAEGYGFSSFNFLKTDSVGDGKPYYLGSIKPGWQTAYKDNDFVSVDPCVLQAVRSKIPFTWTDVRPPYSRGRKSGAVRMFEAARDFRYTDGLVIPHVFTDHLGRHRSALVLFVWEHEPAQKLAFMLSEIRHDLHIVTIYWIDRAVRIRRDVFAASNENEEREVVALLTERERTVLTWAARGDTVAQTSERLKLAEITIEGHLASAYHKLNARNKTYAAVRAVSLGLIDP